MWLRVIADTSDIEEEIQEDKKKETFLKAQ